MKANTAVAVVLCGIGLLVLSDRSSVRLERFAQSMALLAAAIGMATLVEYFFGWPLGIDEWLVRDVHKAYNIFRGRMSPYSAATFVTLGAALATMPVQSRVRRTVWQS